MAFITADRVKDTSTTTGTGDITVSGGAPSGYRTFSTVLSVGDTFYYCVTGQASSEWEVGLGTYLSTNTFARTIVLASSASGSAVSFSSGTKNVFITLPANKTLQLDAAASPTAGAILYGTGSMLAYTAVGTSGQFLQSNGSAAPTWAPAGTAGTAISNGTSNVNIASSNGAVTVATNGTTAVTVDTSQNVSVIGTVAMASSFKRNRIINGNMVIDQRNAGASVTAVDNGYTLDRWQTYSGAASKFTVQQQTSVVPTGFTYALKVTSSSAYTAAAGEAFSVNQNIEGYNVADLGFGTANAKTITISFWVYSSLTGTFGAAIRNANASRSYPFSYSISSANTWEQKTVTIVGDTTGTWTTTNGIGIAMSFNLGSGSNFLATAGAWNSNFSVGVTGNVSVIGTSGATWYITGVQLEVGTKATPYEMQIYSDQLAQCQRYYNAYSWASTGWGISTTQAQGGITFPVMRTSPTISDGGSNSILYGPGGSLGGSVSFSGIAATRAYLTFTASGGQTTNYPCVMYGIANMAAEL